MKPEQLTEKDFSGYHTKAHETAVASLPLLKQLPLGFAPFLLKEIITEDVKFPAESKELSDQLAYLQAMSAPQLQEEMKPFAGLQLSAALEAFDWVNSPQQFLEQLSAHLWATHQMDGFRAASENYVQKFHTTLKPAPLPVARAGIVVIGAGARESSYKPFAKLQREGTVFNHVKAVNGLETIRAAIERRAEKFPVPYAHIYLDGAEAVPLKGCASVGYGQLSAVRAALAGKMLTAYTAQHFDPEMLRTNLARTSYESLGIKPSGDPVLDQFSLTLLTEGSGTQIYSTTFVQWAAREALRRAQPLTLCAHFAPRQRARSMDELLTESKSLAKEETDAAGSLIDADMGAYYTWLNQQRLPGAEDSRFLAWFENRSEAVLIAPHVKKAMLHPSEIKLESLIETVLD